MLEKAPICTAAGGALPADSVLKKETVFLLCVSAGRAAMHSFLAAFVVYLAIMAGLGLTLLLLALHKKALPALPLSICLGVSSYFLTVSMLEPFALMLVTRTVMF